MAKVLIPGGYGFIGAHLTRACLLRGDEITVLSLARPRPCIDFDVSRVRHVRIDLRDGDSVKRLLRSERPDLVFNLSGYIDHAPYFKGGRQVLDQHFLALQNLLDSIDRSALRLFVQVGSSDEYGAAPSPQREEARECPIAPYSLGKLAAARLIDLLARTESFPGVAVRLFLVYGPGQDSKRFIPQVIQGCLSGQPFPVSEGRQERDFTFVEDIVAGLLALEKSPKTIGHILNLASGVPVAIRDVVQTIVQACGQGQPLYGAVPYRPGENMSLVADVARRNELSDWKPRVSLKEGLQKTLEWVRAQPADRSQERKAHA